MFLKVYQQRNALWYNSHSYQQYFVLREAKSQAEDKKDTKKHSQFLIQKSHILNYIP